MTALLAAAALIACWPGLGAAEASSRSVQFDGKQVRVPAKWPVYRLAQHPRMCVRLDRRAVYLGTPGANQRCPATAMGRQRAILIEPAAAARPSGALPRAARPQASASAGGAVFTGLGFDACTAPSTQAMNAWLAASPYRAVGVYIGGNNRACSQPNLTASWVETHTAKGWHLIPTYVGLQATTSSCTSCATLSPSRATAQGAAAAVDAVAQASALSMGPGSPIYYDMESYARTASATSSTLAFLEAWTIQLRQLGYTSGVYSSSASGIADLVDQIGTGYVLPDDVWFANWNGVASTYDPYIPANAWTPNQRIHQYRGGHDERFGGVTINIDNNYVDGATVGSGATATLPGADDPIGSLDLTGSPRPGQFRVRGWAFDPNAPTQPLAIRVSVGGRAGSPNALEYDLGLATGARADVAAAYPEAGSRHGFDASIPTAKSRRQPICAYAVGVAPGGDRLLGCRTTGIPVAITLSNIRVNRDGVRVRITCRWPRGVACPGRLTLRTRIKVAVRRGQGRPARVKSVRRSLARRPFKLTGNRSHLFKIRLNRDARKLLLKRGRLRTQLVAAIPGGRRVQVLTIKRR